MYIGSAEGSFYPRTDRMPCRYCGATYAVRERAWYVVKPPSPKEKALYEKQRQELLKRLSKRRLRWFS